MRILIITFLIDKSRSLSNLDSCFFCNFNSSITNLIFWVLSIPLFTVIFLLFWFRLLGFSSCLSLEELFTQYPTFSHWILGQSSTPSFSSDNFESVRILEYEKVVKGEVVLDIPVEPGDIPMIHMGNSFCNYVKVPTTEVSAIPFEVPKTPIDDYTNRSLWLIFSFGMVCSLGIAIVHGPFLHSL